MWLQTVANQFLNMEPLEHGVANSCKSVSKYGTVGSWGCKQLQISFEIWNHWNIGLQTVANQFLNIEPLEHGVSNSCKSFSKYGTVGTLGCKHCKSVYEYGTVGTWGCKQLQISFIKWNRWKMGLQTVANQFLNMKPLEDGVANSCESVFNHGIIGTWGCKQFQISF